MKYFKKYSLKNEDNIFNIKIIIDIDDISSIKNIFDNIQVSNSITDFLSMSDDIYKLLPNEVKLYDINIIIEKNDIVGYEKEYPKIQDKISVVSSNKDNETTGIIFDDGFSIKTYNILEIPDDIKKLICGCNDSPSPSPKAPSNEIDDDDDVKTPDALEKDIKSSVAGDISKDDIDSSDDSSDDKNTSEKRLDIKSPTFHNLFDQTLDLMDNIGPSQDLLSDLSKPDPWLRENIKNFFSNKG